MASGNLVSLFSGIDPFPSPGFQVLVSPSPFSRKVSEKSRLLSSNVSFSKSLWQCHVSSGNGSTSQSSRTSAEQGCYRTHISPGVEVDVVCKTDQRSGKLTRGVVADILTNSSWHPRGIKVRLIGGAIGRVQEIVRKSVRKDVRESNLGIAAASAQQSSTVRSNPIRQSQIQSQSQIQRGLPQAIASPATASKSSPGEVSSGNPNVRKGNENVVKGSSRTSPFANLQQFKSQLPGAIVDATETEEIVSEASGELVREDAIQLNEEAEIDNKVEVSGKTITAALKKSGQGPVVVQNDESESLQLDENGQGKGFISERLTQKTRGRKEMEERKKKIKKEKAERRKEDGLGAEPSRRRVREGTGLGLLGLADLKSAISFSEDFNAPAGSGNILNDNSVNSVDRSEIEVGNTSSDIDDKVSFKSDSSAGLTESSLENAKELGNLEHEAEVDKKQAIGDSSKLENSGQLAREMRESTIENGDGRREPRRKGPRTQKDSAILSNSSGGNERKKTTSSESRAESGLNRGKSTNGDDKDGRSGSNRKSADNNEKNVTVSKGEKVVDSGWRAERDTGSKPEESEKGDSHSNNEEMQNSRSYSSAQRQSVSRLDRDTNLNGRRGEGNKKELKVDNKESNEVQDKVESSGGAPPKPQVTGEMILAAMQKAAIERAKIEAEKKAKASRKDQGKMVSKEVEVIEGPVRAITVRPEWAEEIANLKLRLKELKSMSI